MAKFRIKKGLDVMAVVKKIAKAILSLYVGGTILIQLGNVMNQTESPFYLGLRLIGWTVGAYPNNGVNWSTTCIPDGLMTATTTQGAGCITNTSGNGGILAVVGIVAIASVILEFVEVKW